MDSLCEAKAKQMHQRENVIGKAGRVGVVPWYSKPSSTWVALRTVRWRTGRRCGRKTARPTLAHT